MSSTKAAVLVLAATIVAGPIVHAEWIDRYDRAVRSIDAEQSLDEVQLALEALLDEQPYPQRRLTTSSGERVDYLPYLQMARVQLAAGAWPDAELSLDISEAFGAWDKQRDQRELYRSLRSRIERQRKAVAVAAR